MGYKDCYCDSKRLVGTVADSTVGGVGCPVMAPSPSSPVQTQQLIEVTSRRSSPGSPRPAIGRRNRHRRAKHRKVGWAGCKDCAKSDMSSDEVECRHSRLPLYHALPFCIYYISEIVIHTFLHGPPNYTNNA